MSFKIKTISVFEKQAKRLSKKYPSLKKDLLLLVNELSENPEMGTSLGSNCYKVRFAITSKGKGKSGGARIITNIAIMDQTVYLLSIYDKSEVTSITDKELKELLKYLP
ncbi:MAG: hypothetical protein K0S32_2119 [Bacteroidetes bacterium]|jgi:mRNA-degrading endonuclease RelE of RelBE toxin-antitoxin system|nr:hypothetical protein [Bacteroidota bacterium]